MEESSNKTMMIIAGLGSVLLVITFGFFIVNFAINKGNDITNTVSEKMDTVLESEYTQYDGEEITGSAVVNMIKTVDASSDDIYVLVKTNANTSGVYYVCDSNNTRLDADVERGLIKDARTKTNNNYITPSEKFYGEVIRNQNKAIVGVSFTQQ